jgi:hypothetical protein
MNELPVVLRSYLEGLKTHDVDRIARAVAEDLGFVTTSGILSKQQFLAMLRALYAGFPDWYYDHDEPEFRPDVIAVKYRQGGHHTGTFSLPGLNPLPATGTLVTIPAHYFFYKLRGQEIVEIRPEPVPGAAPLGILEQLGIRGTALSFFNQP